MRSFSVTVEQFDAICYVQVRGELDLATADEFRTALNRGHGQFLVDFTDLAFIDGRGLSVLIELSLLQGLVGLRKAPPQLHRIIEIVGAAPLFAFEDRRWPRRLAPVKSAG